MRWRRRTGRKGEMEKEGGEEGGDGEDGEDGEGGRGGGRRRWRRSLVLVLKRHGPKVCVCVTLSSEISSQG